MVLSSYSFTSPGGREENQDSVGIREEGVDGIYVVADGLGGHRDGKEASSCVVDSMLKACGTEDAEISEKWLKRCFSDANAKILELQKEKNSTMKSTATALIISGSTACWAHTGDCRLYHLRSNRIEHITEDHSVAYKKYKAGQISRAQLCTDEDQSVLLKVLGNNERWEPETNSCAIEQGDAFLLCSDGMWEYIWDEEILVDWLKSDSPKEWAEYLLLRAINRIDTGNDNLSIITLMID